MEHDIIVHVQLALKLFTLIILPPLAAALISGVLIGILQTATQIQDQTLSMAGKIIAVGITLAAFAPFTFRPLMEHAQQILSEFPAITR